MYADPSLIRDHPVRVYFNEQEAKLVDALTEYTGEQRASLIRRLIIEQATAILHGEADLGATRQMFEQPEQALKRA